MRGKRTSAMVATLAIGALALAAALAAGDEKKEEKGIPDATLSLSRTGVFEVATPPAVVTTAPEAGESVPLARAHPEAPPVVPHAVADFLPITRDANACVDCHAVEERVEGEPVPIPPSHYVDLRNAPGVRRDEIAGARWVCVSCHVARTDAAPLVPNPFGMEKSGAESAHAGEKPDD